MFKVLLAGLISAVFLAGCVIHQTAGETVVSNSGEEKEVIDEGITKSELEVERDSKNRETQDFRSCPADLGFQAATPSPSMPQVVTSANVEIVTADATLKMKEDGRLGVDFDLRFSNDSKKEETVRVGYAWRVMRGGPSNLDTYEVSGESVFSCAKSSDPKLRMPFKEYFSWAEVKVPAKDSVQAKGSILFSLDRREKSESLFGFVDGFANNWKNFDWPYTKAPEYEKISDRAKPYMVVFHTMETKGGVRIKLEGTKGEPWLRSHSYEHLTSRKKGGSSVVWQLPAKDGPRQISFEYLPGLDLPEERETFERIVEHRTEDLRAKIHLSDLYLMEGNHEARVKVIVDLLEKWEKNAKAQLLTARNDVRGPAYVALVESYSILDSDDKARKAAEKGLEILSGLDQNLEMNRFAKIFLERTLK